MHSTSSMALLRARPILASFQFFDGGIPLSARRGLITRLEDYGGSEKMRRRSTRGWKRLRKVGNRRQSRVEAGIEAARISGCRDIRETRIVLHNFRLVSRPEELQLLSLSSVEFRRLLLATLMSATLPSFPRHSFTFS